MAPLLPGGSVGGSLVGGPMLDIVGDGLEFAGCGVAVVGVRSRGGVGVGEVETVVADSKTWTAMVGVDKSAVVAWIRIGEEDGSLFTAAEVITGTLVLIGGITTSISSAHLALELVRNESGQAFIINISRLSSKS